MNKKYNDNKEINKKTSKEKKVKKIDPDPSWLASCHICDMVVISG
jgi:hypothetical protein